MKILSHNICYANILSATGPPLLPMSPAMANQITPNPSFVNQPMGLQYPSMMSPHIGAPPMMGTGGSPLQPAMMSSQFGGSPMSTVRYPMMSPAMMGSSMSAMHNPMMPLPVGNSPMSPIRNPMMSPAMGASPLKPVSPVLPATPVTPGGYQTSPIRMFSPAREQLAVQNSPIVGGQLSMDTHPHPHTHYNISSMSPTFTACL